MPDAQNPVAELTTDECWELLEGCEFGRLAYRLVDELHIVPINYVVDGGSLLFRTTAGNKLLSAALHSQVAFEADWYDDTSAWSVVVRGTMRRLGEDEAHRLDEEPRLPWVPEPRPAVIELVPEVVTGRSFHLQRPHVEPPQSPVAAKP